MGIRLRQKDTLDHEVNKLTTYPCPNPHTDPCANLNPQRREMVLRVSCTNLRKGSRKPRHPQGNVFLPTQIQHYQGHGTWYCGILFRRWIPVETMDPKHGCSGSSTHEDLQMFPAMSKRHSESLQMYSNNEANGKLIWKAP
jgi:hypothetical protein